MSAASSQQDPSGGAARRVMHSVTRVDGLLVLLTVLYFLVAHGGFARPLLYVVAICLYAALVLALRFAGVFNTYPREKLVVATVAMVLFITSVLAFAGGDRGPLLNLYLLPIVTGALTLGRQATVSIVILVLGCRIALSHFVEGHDVVTLAYALLVLAEAVPVLLVALLTSALAADIHDANERLQVMAESDELTGLLNLQTFTRLISEERERAVRRGSHFALMLVDVEGLKSVNDRYGHEAGNRALAAVAQALKRSTRSVDLVARYGGDEFVVFLAGAGPAIARAVANRIRHNVATTTLQFGGILHRVTVGIGAASFPAEGRELRDLINAASRDVEKDKESRRPLVRDELRASGTGA